MIYHWRLFLVTLNLRFSINTLINVLKWLSEIKQVIIIHFFIIMFSIFSETENKTNTPCI